MLCQPQGVIKETQAMKLLANNRTTYTLNALVQDHF